MVFEKRLYIGNIQKDQENCVTELQHRFERFGKCLSDHFECHEHFAYVNMQFDNEQQFNKLKSSFNNVKFKGNILRVDAAKMDWHSRWELENSDTSTETTKQQHMLNQQLKHAKKLENINMSWKDRREVIRGRNRTTPRKKLQLRNITFRVNVNGHLKVYKCYKTKLWGYERNKKVRDLVYRFVNAHWKDGNDHIVDRLDYSRSRNPIHFKNRDGDILTMKVTENANGENEEEEEKIDDMEKEKNNQILASLLGNFDFEKPVQLEEDEEYGSSDYEYDAMYKETAPVSKETPQDIEYVKEGEFKHAETNSEEKADDEDSEPIPTFASKSENAATDISSEEEFIPTFGEKKDTTEGTVSNTDTLRSLFNPGESKENVFKLIEESDEDINHDKDLKKEQISNAIQEQENLQTSELQITKHNDKGLFFPHLESPFLVSQAQLSKIKNAMHSEQDIFASWDQQFWDNRATWTREMKQKKRDALRQLKKKNSRMRGTGVLV